MPTIVIKSNSKCLVASQEWIDENYTPDEYIIDPSPAPDLSPPPSHKTEFSPKELYNSFTPQEIILAKIHSDPTIVAEAALLSEGRDKVINSADADYQSTVDKFEAAGVITADRATDYRQGIPLNTDGRP